MDRKIILITGAGGSLGSAILERFYKQNSEFDIIAFSKVQNVQTCFKNIKVDLEEPLSTTFWTKLFDILNGKKVAGLIWAAGVFFGEEFSSPYILENFQKQWYINCYNLLEMTQKLCSFFDCEVGGQIIAISSMLAKRSTNGSFSYSTTKGMQDILVQKLAYELAKYNVRVNSINPGLFRSNMSEQTWSQQEKIERLQSNIPLRHFVHVNELVNLIHFIFHGNCKSLTGQNIFIEGGNLLCFSKL
ncbi:unnamed protein product [Sphagnum jensenii]|uniref:Uncharacterized protein n=1 Tax=Sphagnum jensenii TaxID=128206 RepID=A0ABP0VBU2_9BRYO